MSQRGRAYAAARNSDGIVLAARAAMGDFLNIDPRGVVFGRSATQLIFDFADTLTAGLGAGDEIVVSRLDHDANIRPWVLAAEKTGASLRWVDFDPTTVPENRGCRTRVEPANETWRSPPPLTCTAASQHSRDREARA